MIDKFNPYLLVTVEAAQSQMNSIHDSESLCKRRSKLCKLMSDLNNARILMSMRTMRLTRKGLSLTSWTIDVYFPPIAHYPRLIPTTTCLNIRPTFSLKSGQ